MSLLSRVHAAAHSTHAPSRARDVALLPFATLRDFLSEDALVLATRVDIRAVHTALSLLCTNDRDSRAGSKIPSSEKAHSDESKTRHHPCPHCPNGALERCVPGLRVCTGCERVVECPDEESDDDDEGPDNGSKIPEGHHQHRCGNCHGTREFLDAHGGCRVCADCGAVLTLRAINVEPEFRKAPEVTAPRRQWGDGKGSTPHVTAYSSKVVNDPMHARSDFWNDLEHWNAYAHLTVEELERADRTLRDWRQADGHERLVRLVAVLLYPNVRPQIRDESTLRDAVRTAPFRRLGGHVPQALETIVDPTPLPTFPCPSCDEKLHSTKDARMHCRGTGWGAREVKRCRRV